MEHVQALQAVTTPVADLAARASQLDLNLPKEAHGSFNGSEDDADDVMDDAEDGGSDKYEHGSEVSLTPRVLSSRKAAGDPPSQRLSKNQSPSKKGIRFAEGTPDTQDQRGKVMKVHKPFANIKDSVYISGNSFDFHGTPLEDDDVVSLADQGSDVNNLMQPGHAFSGGETYQQQHMSQDW